MLCVACQHGELLQDCEKCRPINIAGFMFTVTKSDTDAESWPLKSPASMKSVLPIRDGAIDFGPSPTRPRNIYRIE